MRTSFKEKDVTLLLTDITGKIEPLSTEEREKRIQMGISYGKMLPYESQPSEQYIQIFKDSIDINKVELAQAIIKASKEIYKRKEGKPVLVSLARGGTPIGILIKRCIKALYKVDAPHYSISIIRGEGLDVEAMKFICQLHRSKTIQFVDGWIGKGAITQTLSEHCEILKEYALWAHLDSTLAVVSDPAHTGAICGTHNDILIPSACLNATVSGLISRTVNNEEILPPNSYHGAVYYEHLQDCDYTNYFLDSITSEVIKLIEATPDKKGIQECYEIADHYGIGDINKIKPGIGETTRVLLRRVPWKVLVRDKNDTVGLEHIYKLCQEKGIEVDEYPLVNYRVCGIIKHLADI